MDRREECSSDLFGMVQASPKGKARCLVSFQKIIRLDSFRRELGPEMAKQGEPEAQAQIRDEPAAGSHRWDFLMPLPRVAIGWPCFSGQTFLLWYFNGLESKKFLRPSYRKRSVPHSARRSVHELRIRATGLLGMLDFSGPRSVMLSGQHCATWNATRLGFPVPS
jgi:hypothetical protein